MKTFKIGGVHPKENKLTAGKAIEYLPVPPKVSIPLSQSLGAPSKVLVEKGTYVKVGQLIAKGEAFISANVHSSVSGKVVKIDETIDSSGYRKPAIIIDVEGDEWEETIDRSVDVITDIKLSRQEIVDKIKDFGVVGLGGATFPTHVKLMVPADKKAQYLIINGVECEPYLTADHRIMLEKAEEIITGIRVLMLALDVHKAFIGIENNKKDAVQLLRKHAVPFKEIEVVPLKVKYPQGGEKQLIKAVTGREVPSGKLPIETGCIVNNVGTALAVYEAVQKNKPLIERVVTVTGKTLLKPGNFMVRIGTSVSYLVEHAGGLPENTGKVVSGGPMMGKALTSLEVPVVKGTSGILIFSEKASHRLEMHSCIRCSRCIGVCPMGLLPFQMVQYVVNDLYDDAEKAHIMDCMECGCCVYTCPSGRPVLDYMRLGKNRVGNIIRNRVKN
ncbi:MAG TPA: electron transport complex subunit RsxC [Lentimicrobium sp.]|nr:electron transport complex subunit RsxC [Lentimicrobium sp.]